MTRPTTAQIDAAVPPAGVPDRLKTNIVLKGLLEESAAAIAAVLSAEGNVVGTQSADKLRFDLNWDFIVSNPGAIANVAGAVLAVGSPAYAALVARVAALEAGGVGATAPVNTVAPSISGTTTVGSLLTASPGTWTGSPTPTYTYVWKRGGAAISGATASTYTLVTGDIGATITCTVTATNTAGNASVTTAGVGPVTSSGSEYDTKKAAAIAAIASATGDMIFLGTPADLVGYAFQDAAGTVASGVGDPVALIKGRNGNLYPQSQTDNSRRPVIQLLSNGYCAIKFVYDQRFFNDFHPNALAGDRTLIVAPERVTYASTGRTVAAIAHDDAGNYFPAIRIVAGTTDVQVYAQYNYNSSNFIYVGNGSPTYPIAAPPVLSSKLSGSTGTLYANGTSIGTNTLPTPVSGDTQIYGTLGGYGVYGEAFEGNVVLWAGSATAMSDANRSAIEAFATLLKT